MAKKKVLFLSPLPPPKYGSAMSSKMCLEILQNSKEFEAHSIKLNFASTMSGVGKINPSKILGVFRIRREIKKALEHFKPDIVYIVPATTSVGLIRDSHIVNYVSKRFSRQILVHIRSRVLESDWKSAIKRRMLYSMFKNKKVIVVGEALKGDVRDAVPEQDIISLPNAIQNEVSESEIKKTIAARRKHKRLELLFLSNMEKSKGWVKVLHACKLLKKENVTFHCRFAGEWKHKDDEKEFYTFIKRHNLQNDITYLGIVSGEQKNNVLKETDILIFPTEYPLETFGRVLIEAMMHAAVTIANNHGTVSQIIEDDKTGYILERNTPEEIKNRILDLKSVKKRETMGKRGRKQFLEKFELKTYKKGFLDIFKSQA